MPELQELEDGCLRADRGRLERLERAIHPFRRFLVLTHDNPDPDSMASAWLLGKVLGKLGRSVALAYGGMVGRTENRAMIDVLRLPLRPLASFDLDSFDAFGIVDAQPGTGNNSLPPARPTIVFDHHPRRRRRRGVVYEDIREEYGATTTILFEYLLAAGIHPDRRLATAVFHAIRSETQNLGREAGRADARAFLACFPLVNNQALSRIENSRLPRNWFEMIDQAIDGTRIYGDVAVTLLGQIPVPDMVAEFADLIVRLEGIAWALSIGRYGSDLLLSIRTNETDENAGRVIRKIVAGQGTAGGHEMIAGGKLTGAASTDAQSRRTEQLLVRRLLEALHKRGVRPRHLSRVPGPGR
ncbi:MAG: bifunctional oligoribonuclease/PAP phosphatase NrnA [Candidatus Eisenbacteria bacterium]|nr:DHH family phosphoesterase [Candidatus Eisenbacteria bacterium]